MDLYLIRRRRNWKDAKELEATAEKSARVGNEEMADKVRWIRSYVVREDDGSLGTLCVYEGTDKEVLREHATRVGMTVDEIVQVARTVVMREDPARR